MQFKQTLVRLLLIFCPFIAVAQTTYLPQGDKQNILLERMEIKAGRDSVFNFSKTKPFSRKQFMPKAIEAYYKNDASLSKVDRHNLRSMMLNNQEWLITANKDLSEFKSKKPIWKRFYTTPASLYEVHVKDFDLVVNPVFQYTLSKEKDNDQDLFLNTRGVMLRGRIANKILALSPCGK